MAVDALRVQVLFSAIDRLTAPLKSMGGGSAKLKAALAGTRKEIQSLERAQGRANAFRKAEGDYRRLGDELKVARLEAKAAALSLSSAEKPTAALARAAEKAAIAEAKAGAAYQRQGEKLQRLGNELEAAGVDVSRLIEHEDKLELKVYEANKRLKEQEQRLEGVARSAARAEKVKGIGDKITRAGGALSVGVTLPAVAFGKAAFDAAGDAVELQSAFDTTFGKMAPAMNKWAEATGNAMGRSTQEMQRGANTFGLYFNQVADPKKAAAMSQQYASLAQDLGSFFNTDTETAIESLRSGLSGESEPLRKFGVFLNDAAVNAKALEMGLKGTGKGNKLTDEQKVLARYQLILDKTKVAQGDVARTADSPANRLRRSKAAFEELQVTVGQKLIPALVPLVVQITSLMERFNGLDPATQGNIVKAIALAAALGPVLTVVGGLTRGVGVLLPVLDKIGPAFLRLGMGAARAGAFLLTNPIFLVVAAIAGVAFLIWKHWDTIKAAFGAAKDWLAAKAAQLGALFMRFPGLFGPLGSLVALVVRNWDRIKAAFGAGLAYIQALPGRFLSLGGQIIQGLINGVTGKLAALKRTIVNAASSAASWFKQKLGIRSPSRVFMGFGANISEGLARGIGAGEGSAIARVDRLSSRVAGAFAASALVAAPAAATVAGAPGAASSPAAAASSSAAPAVTIGSVTIQIMQQPGENGDELAKRIAARLASLDASAARSSFDDA